MNKISCVVSACPDTYSGYGQRSLDLIKELIRVKPDWNISILSQRWGNCRMGYLKDHKETDILQRVIPELREKPDVWIQITVPNEFQAMGKYNIGITAAMETTLCDSSWVVGCNRMDLVIVSSKHGKFSLTNSKYINNKTQGNLEVTTPIEVLFEGLDANRYYNLRVKPEDSLLKEVKTPWNFLCVGHWMQGDFGEDRKNIGYTVKVFLETFKDQDVQPGLILKTTQASSSISDKYEILNRLYRIRESVSYKKSLPPVYLLHGELSDKEMNLLYNDPKVKAMVSFTKGEGFGRPLLEFASIGKPILCSGWSGHLDFLEGKYTGFVGGSLEKVHPSAAVKGMILTEASWFKPDDMYATAGYEQFYKNYKEWLDKAKKQGAIVQKLYTRTKMGESLKNLILKYVPDFPEEVELTLPEIK